MKVPSQVRAIGRAERSVKDLNMLEELRKSFMEGD